MGSVDYHRSALGPRDFRIAVARILALHPNAQITSAGRFPQYNESVGGGTHSKHLFFPLTPIAADITFNEEIIEEGSTRALELEHEAKILGLWAVYHKGHLHVQGLRPGPVMSGYFKKHMTDAGEPYVW